MHHLTRALASALLFFLGSGACFSPDLPDQIACGEGGSCPPGLRCETSANICVSEDQAAVVAFAFTAQLSTVEAVVVAPKVVVELRNAAGEVVDISGGTFAIELEANPAGVHVVGSAIESADHGVVTFDELQFDKPGHGLRLTVHGGDVSSTSAAFEVTATRPAITQINPGLVLDGCATVTYVLQQAQSLPVDLLVEVDPDGPTGPEPFRRATQAPSEPGKPGVQGVRGSPQGRTGTFAWNNSADLPRVNATIQLRITPSIGDLLGTPMNATLKVRNGPRFSPYPVGATNSRIMHMFDQDHDGRPTAASVDYSTGTIPLDFGTFTIPPGEHVTDLAVGDFDGDALIDLVVALDGRTVFARQQREPFQSLAPPVAVGAAAFRQVLAADVDRDGRAEIVGIEKATGHVVVLRTVGSEFVELARPWTVGSTGHIFIDDLDRDGWSDIVVGRSTPSLPVAELRGTQAGFAAPQIHESLRGDIVAAGDLDHDGKLEVAALDDAGLHVATATGAVVVPGVVGRVLALRDVDGDGRTDVVTATDDTVFLSVHVSDRRAIAFRPAEAVGHATGVTKLFVHDFERDGRVDVYALSDGDPTALMTLFVGAMSQACGPSLAGPQRSDLLQGFYGGAYGDINGDGKLDLIGSDGIPAGDARIFFYPGRGDGSFINVAQTVFEWPSGGKSARKVIARDLDHDGAVDLVVPTAGIGAVTVLYNDAQEPGTFLPVELSAPVPEGIAVADMNGDFADDVVALESGQITIWPGDPAAKRSFGAPRVLEPILDAGGPVGLCAFGCEIDVHDFNADGNLDIVVSTPDGTNVLLADEVAQGGFRQPIKLEEPPGSVLFAGDFIGDERAELLLRVGSADVVQLAIDGLNTSETALERIWASPPGSEVGPAVLVDLDGDGLQEALVHSSGLQHITRAGEPALHRFTPSYHLDFGQMFAADFDGDGLPEIISVDDGLTTIQVDEKGDLDLGELLTPLGSGQLGGFGTGMALGDFSGDGLVDLATLDPVANGFQLSRQNTEQPGVVEPPFSTIAGSYFVKLADIDGDRRADAVSYGQDGGLIYLGLEQANAGMEGLCLAKPAYWPLAVGDITGDGRADLVISGSHEVQVLSAPADSCSEPITVMSLDRPGAPHWHPRALQLADMNLDGLLDVVVIGDAVRVALQVPEVPITFAVTDYEYVDSPDFKPYYDGVVALVDRDAFPDVIATDKSGLLRVFLNDGAVLTGPASGRLTPSQVVSDSSGNRAWTLTVGDLDGDGSLDIVTTTSRKSHVYLQDAAHNGTFRHSIDVMGPGDSHWDVDRATIVDFDADGRQDLIYVDHTQGTMLLRGR